MVTEARTTGDGATPSSPVEAVDRALLALQALAQAGARGASLAELASVLELNKTTLHRTLAALRFRGFVVQAPGSGVYVLGPSATQLADDFLSDENLPALLRPALVALSGAAAELTHLGVLSGTQVIYLDKVEPDRSVRVWSAVGRRSPAVTTALGRALLAYQHLDRSLLPGYLDAARESRTGPLTLDADQLWATLQSARERGYATEVEENEPGISCVAVPLLRADTTVAAISITAPAERMTPERVAELHQHMRRLLPPLLPTGLSLPG